MKIFVSAMSDMEHDKRSWRCLGSVVGFIALNILLRVASREQAILVKQAVASDNDIGPLVFTGITAVGQVLAAVLLIKIESPRGDLPNREALSIIVCAHLGSMFLSSFLASLGQTYGSLASALTEPVMALAALWVVTSIPGRTSSWLGLVLFSFGATFMSLNYETVMSSDRTSLIQGLAGFTLVLRNIIMHHLFQNENVSVQTRGSLIVTGLVVMAGCVMAAVYAVTSPEWLGPVFCSMTSMLISAFLAFVTMTILRRYSVVFLSIFHAVALLTEALVLTPMPQRPNLLPAVSALILIGIGLYLFLKDWVESEAAASSVLNCPKKPVNTHEQYTRVEFLLFSSMVIGVIFYVFQPRLSQRDLHTLSYVGLDKVIRRLLSVSDSN